MQDRSGSLSAPKLKDPSKIALFLDLDGTVLDIARAPSEVVSPPGLAPALETLQAKLGGAVAVLTGRKIADVDRILSPLKLAAGGVHGSEIRLEPDAAIEVDSGSVPEPLLEAVRKVVAAAPGLLLEHKGISLAVHYRA